MRRRFLLVAALAVLVLVVVALLPDGGEGVDPTLSGSTGASVPTGTGAATGPTLTLAPPGDGDRARIVWVYDGDTVDAETLSGERDKVRLLGINTPERDECFAETASRVLRELVKDEVVTMTSDVTDRDQYGRLLRYLWLDDGTFLNELLVLGGYALARDFPPNSSYADTLARAQRIAQDEGRGLWADDACGAASDAEVEVVDVLANPRGPDDQNLNGEWVEIVNTGSSAVALDGWTVKDDSSVHRYAFPDGFTLAPHAVVRIHAGCGSDTDDTLYWCSTVPIWSNSGDTAFVVDPNGNIVDSFSY